MTSSLPGKNCSSGTPDSARGTRPIDGKAKSPPSRACLKGKRVKHSSVQFYLNSNLKMAWKRGWSRSSSETGRAWERGSSGKSSTQCWSSQAGQPSFLLPRLVSLGVIFYKRLFQGHEQEVELQKAAHNKEIAKIQQQLVRVTAVENW